MNELASGVQPWLPNFDIVVEGNNITEEVRKNLIHLSVTDNGGNTKQSDQISFGVASETLVLPPKGVKVSVAIGYGQHLVNKGTYVVDALFSGGSATSHRIVMITARAFSKTNARGHSTLQSQKTRTWSNITLGDLVKTVSAEHKLTASLSPELENIQIDHVDQLGESDMNLLTRLGERYGAVNKVTHDHWALIAREATTSSGGKPLKKQVITKDMVTDWRYNVNSDTPDASSAGGGTYVISYRDVTDGGKIKTITVGSGEPVTQFAYAQPDLKGAKEIAASFSTSSKKKLRSMSLTLPAPEALMYLTAQCLISTSGFGKVEDRDWHIASLKFNLTTQGFVLNLELE